MLKAIFRAGLIAGAASGAYFLARKYFGSEMDQAIDKAKSTAKDVAKDFTRHDKAVTSSVENASRKAM